MGGDTFKKIKLSVAAIKMNGGLLNSQQADGVDPFAAP
jgi:hypothetical protein